MPVRAEVLEAEAERMPRDARDSARLAVSETRKLTRLVEDLIEVSRFDAGAATLRPENVELRAWTIQAGNAERAGAHFAVRLPRWKRKRPGENPRQECSSSLANPVLD